MKFMVPLFSVDGKTIESQGAADSKKPAKNIVVVRFTGPDKGTKTYELQTHGELYVYIRKNDT